MENRYSRQLQLPGFGPEAQQKLNKSNVLVVGAGGLGVPVLQYLAGMGIGTLGLVDGDHISLTNLHRQVLYSTSEVGQLKVEVAVQKLAQLNPEIQLIPFPTHLTPENALEIMKEYDLIIDATDNFEARYLINDACVLLGKPFVYGALHQFEGQVSVFNLADGPTYRCLYPTPPSAQEIPDCNTAGVLGVVPGLIGLQQALEAVKVLTGIGKSLSGYLLMLDFLNQTQYKIKLKANPENQRITSLQPSYTVASCASVPEVTATELYGWLNSGKKMLLLDVREQDEYVQGHLQKSLLTPLSVFRNQIDQLPQHLPIITICQKGGRSRKAAELLLGKEPNADVYSLAGGMEAWQAQLTNKLVVK
ncbi:HesA/MoeB/ThiF family protein [Rufibacter hautae]|uniref:Molybdopterin-synthase adenylyltransferase n=1 Tax=Rufibacter hautae TaxID=2595005 RepID=A0A5B6TCP2_9BACT|nr:HesA/MoeB/ThiF family protein [Rufibacter hautae]KAA3438227.1 sulfurtransferase [Rufibacter hautae]